jgi:hypothetical protein
MNGSEKQVFIALLHAPVYNKRMEVVATSITNLDLHDISRAARTYGVKKFFLVHPQESQRELAYAMLGYWREGFGGEYNPDRKEALTVLEIESDLSGVLHRIEEIAGQKPLTVATDARKYPQSTGYDWLRRRMESDESPYLLLFGTGWGLRAEEVQACDFVLDPVQPGNGYNHLSVRSAVSIILDRLLGETWWG